MDSKQNYRHRKGESTRIPCDIEAEKNALGCVFLNNDFIHELSRKLRPGDFFGEENRVIFNAMLSLQKQGKPIGIKFVKDELARSQATNNAALYLGEIINAVDNAAFFKGYVEKVSEAAMQRFQVEMAEELASIANRDDMTPEDRVRATEASLRVLYEGLSRRNVKRRSVRLSDICGKWIADKLNNTPRKLYEVGEDFTNVGENKSERVMLGPKTLSVFGAESGGGKSALVFWLMWEALHLNPGLRVAVCSTEMSAEDILDRLAANVCEIKYGRIFHGNMSEADHEALKAKMIGDLEEIQSRVIFLRPPYHIDDFFCEAKSEGAGLCIIDYLQEVEPPGANYPNTKARVDAVVSACRQFTLRENCAVALVSQINRNGAADEKDGKRPTMQWFKESSNIENNADMAYILTTQGDKSAVERQVHLDCVKAKFGSRWRQEYRFNGSFQRFTKVQAPVSFVPTGANESRGW